MAATQNAEAFSWLDRFAAMGVVIILFLLGAVNIFTGVEFTDTGFISALGWRVFLGQAPGADFDYIRPALSAYIWSIPFHFSYDYSELIARSFVFFEKISFAVLCGLIVRRFCSLRISLFCGGATAVYVFHNIPLMPWHTMDGLFFLISGIFLFSRGSVVLALIAFLLAMFSKQSFYPAAFLVVLMVWHDRAYFGVRRIMVFVLVLVLAFGVVYKNNYLLGVGVGGGLHELFEAGFFSYFDALKLGIIIFHLTVALLVWRMRGDLMVFIVIMPAAATIYYFDKDSGFMTVPSGVTHFSFMAAVLIFFCYCWRKGLGLFSWVEDKAAVVSFMLLATAWMSALSWGYANHLFAYGLIISVVMIVSEKGRFSVSYWPLLVCAAIFLVDRISVPYRSPSILVDRFERIKDGPYTGVYADVGAINKIKEIVVLGHLYPGLSVLPSMPQASLFMGKEPVLRADWKMDVEYPAWQDEIKSSALQRYYAIERDDRVIRMSGKYQSSILRNVTADGEKVASGAFFDVYRF